VRECGGLFDGTPLGKLEVYGPDAARFLDHMYVGAVSRLAVGRARYGLLLNENGVLVDDGIVARLGERHFWVNTTSSGAEKTYAAFEEWLQCEFTRFKVAITPVTSRWVNLTVAGPSAWRWLEAIGLDASLAPARAPHLSIHETQLEGVPLRVLRASFSGELGYEINVPVGSSRALLERLYAGGKLGGGVLYGIEALQVLRIEKGFVHIGTDTDGTTLPGDIGVGPAVVARNPAHFVGRRSLLRPASLDADRPGLVGLASAGKRALPVGAHIVTGARAPRSQGYVTSSAFSPTLQAPVALAMISGGSRRVGERVRLLHLGSSFEATVVAPTFLDPAGARLHG